MLEQSSAPPPSDAIVVFYLRSLTQRGGFIRFVGSHPAALVVQHDIDLEGGVFEVTAGQWLGVDTHDELPFGSGPGAGGFHDGPFRSSGAGASHCSLGGLPGSTDDTATLGATYGSPEIVPLMGGSGGGTSGNLTAADGGDGGGALQLVAGGSIRIGESSHVSADGFVASSRLASEGSGGGSGGAILLEAPTVMIAGRVSADGGNGSEGTDGSLLPGAGATGDSDAEQGGANGSTYGGGGGGFGWVRINTEDGTVDLTDTAELSPALSRECASFGLLTPR